MKITSSMVFKLTGIIITLILLSVTNYILQVKATHYPPYPNTLATPTPTPDYAVTVEVQPVATTLKLGTTFTVAVSIYNHGTTCYFYPFDVSLSEQGTMGPLFQPISPTTIPPPLPVPAIFTITTVATGTATLEASSYGEKFCEGGWFFTYEHGTSAPITVWVEVYSFYLPFVLK